MPPLIGRCPVCDEVTPRRTGDYGDKIYVDCPRCGMFGISGSALAVLERTQTSGNPARALLSHYICKTFSHVNSVSPNTPFLSADAVQAILADPRLPAPREQAANVVRFIGDQLRSKDPSGDVKLPFGRWAAIMGAFAKDATRYTFDHLDALGLVTRSYYQGGTGDGVSVGLTFKGWDYYDELLRAHS